MIATSRVVCYGVVLGIMASCIGCDQITKHIAKKRLEGQPSQSFCGDVLRLEYAENPGAFLGLGGQMPPAARWTVRRRSAPVRTDSHEASSFSMNT